MDPISLALGLGTAAFGAFSSNSARDDARATAERNAQLQGLGLQQQKDMFNTNFNWQQNALAQQLAQARASRQDQYGNEVYFDAPSNTFKTRLTPQQQALLQQQQDLLSQSQRAKADVLTKGGAAYADAATRGAQASGDYRTVRDAYLNTYNRPGPQSEESIRDEIMKLMAQGRGQGDQALATLVKRSELRQQGNMPVINATTWGEQGPGQRLADDLLKGRTQAMQEYLMRTQANDQSIASQRGAILPGMKAFEDTANFPLTPGSFAYAGISPDMSTGANTMAQQSDMAKIIEDALTRGNAGVSGAFDSGAKGIAGAYGAGNDAAKTGVAADSLGANPAQWAALTSALTRGTTGNKTLTSKNPTANGVGATYSSSGIPASAAPKSTPYWFDAGSTPDTNPNSSWFV